MQTPSRLGETQTQQNLLADFEFTFVELPKFKKPLPALSSDEDKWLYFLQNAEKLDEIPEPFLSPIFKEAFEIATQSIWSKNELEVYEYQQMQRMIRESAEATAKNEGWQEGMEQGAHERAIVIVKKLLSLHMEAASIASITGLPVEEVEQLQNGTQ